MIATYVPGADRTSADGLMQQAIPFLAICPKCKRPRPQDDFTRSELLRLLNEAYPVEAYCASCDYFWPISCHERARVAAFLAG